MAVDEDESDVLLAVSDSGESDWVLYSDSAYHLCRDREVFSTYAACEGHIWMANNTTSRVVGKGSVRFRMADRRSVTLTEGRKTRGLYRLEGSVQTGGATVRHGSNGISKENGQGKQSLHRGTHAKQAQGQGHLEDPVVVQERREMLWDMYVRKSGQTRVMQPVQDVHREAQRKETKVDFEKLDERWSHDNSQSDVLCGAPRWGVWGTPVGGAEHLGEKVQALRCGSAYTSMGSGVAR
ncbi:hypothetical protein Acr_12g0008810 [Actinidia rufa]|uniref:Retrovirus-related Pol polyprotein from transposon TNT 1-94-like beta-barrel domain-containing protein n=1 Tax=Actinidia rufa TaxID=165716 RepID=A0A7J0FI18_9ERIC|nr:hypothetical protein Acr_12g0008810 [Actinidia rufa]